MRSKPVMRFFLRVLLVLPFCFGAWYYLGGFLTLMVSFPVEWIMTGLWPKAVSAVEQNGHLLEVVTHYAAPPKPGAPVVEGRVAVVGFVQNPLIYGYSLPLFLALVLAAPGDESSRWRDIGVGAAVLLPVQIFGVCCDILKTLVFSVGPQVQARVMESDWGPEVLALAYQLGYLILPAVTPVVVWVLLNGRYLGQLAPGLQARFESSLSPTPRRPAWRVDTGAVASVILP